MTLNCARWQCHYPAGQSSRRPRYTTKELWLWTVDWSVNPASHHSPNSIQTSACSQRGVELFKHFEDLISICCAVAGTTNQNQIFKVFKNVFSLNETDWFSTVVLRRPDAANTNVAIFYPVAHLAAQDAWVQQLFWSTISSLDSPTIFLELEFKNFHYYLFCQRFDTTACNPPKFCR